jgi:hypothetical protein
VSWVVYRYSIVIGLIKKSSEEQDQYHTPLICGRVINQLAHSTEAVLSFWCALMPTNFRISTGFQYMIEIAEGYYIMIANYEESSAVRSRIDVDKCVSTMYDLLRSLGQYLTRDHPF